MEQKENKFEKIKKSPSKISRKKIIFIIAGVVVLGIATFFAQKYIRLYLAYIDFEDYQYYLSQRNEFYGEKHEIKDWSFDRYLQYLDEAKGAEKKALEEQEKLLDVYRQDTVGGKTPEETLAGFVDALKKRDFDLASKYFWLDKQEEWREWLSKADQANKITEIISELESAPENWTEKTHFLGDNYKNYTYTILVEEKEEVVGVELRFNPFSNIWKIKSF